MNAGAWLIVGAFVALGALGALVEYIVFLISRPRLTKREADLLDGAEGTDYREVAQSALQLRPRRHSKSARKLARRVQLIKRGVGK